MINVTIDFDRTYVQRLASRLGRMDDPIKGTLNDLGKTLKKVIQGVTPVGLKKGKVSGLAKKSWRLLPVELRNNMHSVGVENTAQSKKGFPYPVVLEYGSTPGSRPWPKAGPRTTQASDPYGGGNRIYSRQAPGGMAHRAFELLEIDKMGDVILRALED